MVQGSVEFVHCGGPEGIAHFRPVEGDSHGGQVPDGAVLTALDLPVVGQVVEIIEAADDPPSLRVKDIRNFTGQFNG